jgi:hypothetical protein
VVLLLLVAGLLAIANLAEELAIFAVIAINATIGLVTEWPRGDCVRASLTGGRLHGD